MKDEKPKIVHDSEYYIHLSHITFQMAEARHPSATVPEDEFDWTDQNLGIRGSGKLGEQLLFTNL